MHSGLLKALTLGLSLCLSHSTYALPEEANPTATSTAPLAAVDPIEELVMQPFKARYYTLYRFGFINVSINGERSMQRLPNGNWVMQFNAQASGASFSERSEFTLAPFSLIQPLRYQKKSTGLVPKDNMTLVFDYNKKSLIDSENKKNLSELWQYGLQDNMTYIQQASLDIAKGARVVRYAFYDEGIIKDYEFTFVGEETLDTSMGKLKTLRFEKVKIKSIADLEEDRLEEEERIRNGEEEEEFDPNDPKHKRSLTAWFAPSLQYQVVRLEQIKRGKLVYLIDMTAFKPL